MLEVKDIETSYGTSQVLFGMSLTVNQGEVVSLLGRNGMGKTTTIRSLMGMIRPHAGSVTFEGKPLGNLRDARAPATFQRRDRVHRRLVRGPFGIFRDGLIVFGLAAFVRQPVGGGRGSVSKR